MAEKEHITSEQVKAILDYDPHTGKFTWKPRDTKLFSDGDHSSRHSANAWNGKNAGKPAGTKHNSGYVAIRLKPYTYLAHRLAWLMTYGRFPEHHIDHINGDRSDNRICNLRAASRSQNNSNCVLRSDNTSGYKGVSRRPNGRWVAQISYLRKHIAIGVFDTPEDAYEAYKKTAKMLHGEFARFQ